MAAVLATLTAVVVLAAPSGAGVADPCSAGPAADYACRSHAALLHRTATPAEVEQWTAQLPARRIALLATLARGPEALDRTTEAYYTRFGLVTPSADDTAYWRTQIVLPNGLRRLEAALMANRAIAVDAFVAFAYDRALGRVATGGDLTYWRDRVGAVGRNRAAAEIGATLEARRLRARWAYVNDLGYAPDALSRDYWAERLRTGTSYLDLRIALRSSPDGYLASTGTCAPSAPQVGPTCP